MTIDQEERLKSREEINEHSGRVRPDGVVVTRVGESGEQAPASDPGDSVTASRRRVVGVGPNTLAPRSAAYVRRSGDTTAGQRARQPQYESMMDRKSGMVRYWP